MSKVLQSPVGSQSAVQRLCDISTPYAQSSEQDQLFLAAMKEIVQWHETHSEFYKKLLKKNNFKFDQVKTISDLISIPGLWAHFFKTHEILSVDRQKIYLHLTSSGTLGQKSQVFF